MESNDKPFKVKLEWHKLTIAFVILALVSYQLIIFQNPQVELQPVDEEIVIPNEANEFNDWVNVVARHGNGTVYYNFTKADLITTIGKKMFRNLAGFDNVTSYAGVKYISLGYGASASASDTQVANEYVDYGLTRVSVTPTVLNDTAIQLYNLFTSTGASSYVVNITGTNWLSSGNNNLYSETSIPLVTLNGVYGDTLAVTQRLSFGQ